MSGAIFKRGGNSSSAVSIIFLPEAPSHPSSAPSPSHRLLDPSQLCSRKRSSANIRQLSVVVFFFVQFHTALPSDAAAIVLGSASITMMLEEGGELAWAIEMGEAA